MHVQQPVPGWLDAVAHLPPGGMVLAVSNGGVLVDAKARNPGVVTAYRHYVPDQQFGMNDAERLEIARRYFRAFIDGTYYDKYAPFVDVVLEYNEYVDEGMSVNDPETYTSHYLQAVAMANVWNAEYRPRLGSRLVLCNGPVGNSIEKRFAELAIVTDNILGYHPYTRASIQQWPATVRDPGDWRYHSGRWAFMEQAWGLHPRWAFTEMMPYMGSTEGWRHPSVLGGDVGLLVRMYELWLADLAQTPAFKQGRIVGYTGAWFTVGGNWHDYLLEAGQLIALADAAMRGPRPGQETPMPDNAAVIRSAIADLDSARAKLASIAPVPPAPTPPLFRVRVLVPVLNVRSGPAATFPDVGDVLKDQVIDVYAVAQPSGWYRVSATEERYISGSGAYTVKV